MLGKIENTGLQMRNSLVQRWFRSFVFLCIAAAFVFGAAAPGGAASEGGEGRELVSTGHLPVGFTFATNQVADMSGDFMITGYENTAPPYSAYGFPGEGVGVQTLGSMPIDQMTDIPTTGYETPHSLSLTEGYAYAFSLPGGAYGLLYVRSATPTPSLGPYAITMIFDYRYESGGAFSKPAILGTWGLAMLTYESENVPPVWYAEQSRVTFNADGSGIVAGTKNDGGNEPEERIKPFMSHFTYMVSPKSDGSFTLTMNIGDEQVVNRVVLSDDGSMALMDGTADPGEIMLAVLIRIDPDITHDSFLVGRYYYQGFQFNQDDLADPPDGFGRYMAMSGIHEFSGTLVEGIFRTDDKGAWANSVRLDGSNTIWFDPGETGQGYNVSPTGEIVMGEGAFLGALTGSGSIFAGTGSYGSNDWMSYFFMKQQDRTYATRDLAGKWAVVGFGQENEPSQDMFFMAEIGTMTCDTNGVCEYKFRERSSDGFLGNESGQISLGVDEDGSIGEWLVNGLPSGISVPSTLVGALGNDGNTLLLNAGFDSEDRREVFIAVRAENIGDLTEPLETPDFEPDMLYMRFAGGFQLEFQLEGDMGNVSTVTVTGPAGSGIEGFLLDKEVDESWKVYPSETTFIPSADFPGAFKGEYTFTATYTDGGADTFTFDFDPGTPMEVPAGTGVDEITGTLSWDAVTGAHGYYLVIFSNENGHGYQELYHGEDEPPIQATTFDLFAFMAGLEAAPGDYRVRVVAVDGLPGNEAYGDPVVFSFQSPWPVPGLDQAIRALRVAAGENVDVADIRDVNNDGRIGLAEALFVLQANPGLREPLPPVTSVSGTPNF